MDEHLLSASWVRVAFVLLAASMFLVAWFVEAGTGWFLVAALMAAIMLVLGLHIMGRPTGVLINERNLMSLSRFQMVLWTIIILSAYFTMVMVRVKASRTR